MTLPTGQIELGNQALADTAADLRLTLARSWLAASLSTRITPSS